MRSNDSERFSNCCLDDFIVDGWKKRYRDRVSGHQLENPLKFGQVTRKIAIQSYRVEILARVLMLLEMKLNAEVLFINKLFDEVLFHA